MPTISKKAKERFVIAMAKRKEAEEILTLIEEGGSGEAGQIPVVATITGLSSEIATEGGIRYVTENQTLYTYDGVGWAAVAGGGSGAVDSVNGRTGVVVLDPSDIGLTGDNNSFIGFDGSGIPGTIDGFSIDTISGGLSVVLTEDIVNAISGSVHTWSTNLNAIENAPASSWNIHNYQVNIDTDNDGFDFGTDGNAARFLVMSYNHAGTSDTGTLDFISTNYSLGNGTDPIDINGIGYMYGQGQINANVNISGPIQGYGFQPAMSAGASFSDNSAITAFYDYANIQADLVEGYVSYAASPQLASLPNNRNYSGLSINPNITTFNGNASVNMIAIAGQFGVMGANSSWNAINISPIIDEARYASGLNINMSNVTLYPGVQSSLVYQDLTFEFIQPGDNNTYTVEYTPGATAGNEVVFISGNDITVQIEDGVSTATQIRTKMLANIGLAGAITVTVTGVGSNPQDVQSATSFAGGENPGRAEAIFANGDAQVTGDMTIGGDLIFGGALGIGKLTAYAEQNVVDGGSVPASIHSLVSAPIVAPGVTVSNADTIGINTAALITIGAGATVTTSLLGIAALALPAVLNMDTGSTLDNAAGAVFALSLSGSGSGGTVNEVALCSALAIPDGITTVNRMYGYHFDLPFGDPGTDTWGVYMAPDVPNWMRGSLVIGTTDLPTNDSVGLEINSERAILFPRMNTAARDALTPVEGMQVYNSQTGKFQGYAAPGTWVDLH